MDAHQQQDTLVHLFRNDGVMNHLINEASFVTSSELILSNLFSYISIKNLNLGFRYQLKSGELILPWQWNMDLNGSESLIMPSSKNSILNLLQKFNVLIAQAVLGGKTELQNRERSFVSLQVINQ